LDDEWFAYAQRSSIKKYNAEFQSQSAVGARCGDPLANWGPEVSLEAGDARPPDFAAQRAALLAAKPRALSSIMGLFPPDFVKSLKARGITWFATATTVIPAAQSLSGFQVAHVPSMAARPGCGFIRLNSASIQRQPTGHVPVTPAVAVPIHPVSGLVWAG
jgi:nitronate monooxygenase